MKQERQSDEVPPEQVRQVESQFEQVFSSALYWFEPHAEQAPAEGWFALIFPGGQVRHPEVPEPEQVRQEGSQDPQVCSSALNSLVSQTVQEFAVGELGLTFPATHVLQSEFVPPEQVAQSA